MASVRTPADGRKTWTLLATKPTAFNAAEFNAGVNISCDIADSDSRIASSGSEKINDPAVCEDSNNGAYGRRNFEGSIAPYILLDEDDASYTIADNPVFEAFRVRNTTLWIVRRDGVDYGELYAAGQMIDGVYEVRPDDPQSPTDTSNTYVKRTIPLDVKPLKTNFVLEA